MQTNLDSNIKNTTKLLDMVRRPQHEKANRPPSNFALIWAQVFYNLVALVFDVIAAISVYSFTGGKWWYSVLVFLAGFAPLVMHEALYVRAYASNTQKALALGGVGLSVLTILSVGIMAAVATVKGIFGINAMTTEIIIIVMLVITTVAHGVLAFVYHFSDNGIRANQARQEAIAYHKRAKESLAMAHDILSAATGSMDEQARLETEFGDPDAVAEVIGQLNGVANKKAAAAAAPKLAAVPAPFRVPLTTAALDVPEPVLVDKGNGHH